MKIEQTVLVFLTWINFIEGISVDLCAYFVQGGTCEASCEFEAVHSWGIPLCMHAPKHAGKCCIPLTHPLLRNRDTTKQTTTTTTSTTEPITTTLPTTNGAFKTSKSASRTSTNRKCGQSRRRSRVRRVVGGRRASSGSWPWQVALQSYTGEYLCGGVILNENWILTAAHCFQSSETDTRHVRAYLGSQKLHYDKNRRNYTKTIEKIVQHPKFQRNVESFSNDQLTGQKMRYNRHLHDVALLKLETSLEFSRNIQPVCLPEVNNTTNKGFEQQQQNRDCWVTGWGKGDDAGTIRDLQEVSGRMLDHVECGQKWGTDFTEDITCFGDKGHGPCTGDSGSGMYCRYDDNDGYYLAGIVSWGRDDCAHDEHPSVLMGVASYMNWIESVIGAK